jgi:hypothetical protein
MKRLACVVGAIGIVSMAGEATAAPSTRDHDPRACWQRAETIVRGGVEGLVYVEVGADVRQEAPRAFVCYEAPEASTGEGPFGGVISASVDPEYGRVEASCSKRKDWGDLGCGRRSQSVPAQATTPVEHPYGPWGVRVLGIDLEYAFDSSLVAASAERGAECTAGKCVSVERTGVKARRGAQYRAMGWRCDVDPQGSCDRSGAPSGATVGEQQSEPTVTVGSLDIDLPSLCVEASAGIRC